MRGFYERLSANGKTGKQAVIAVCNTCLKQGFAVKKTACAAPIIVRQNC